MSSNSFLVALIPSLGFLFFFALVLRSVLLADRRERAAAAKFQAEQGVSGRRPAGPAPAPGAASGEAPDGSSDSR